MKKFLICIIVILSLLFFSLFLYLKSSNTIICNDKIEKIIINENVIKKENDDNSENIYEAEMLNSKKYNIIKLYINNEEKTRSYKIKLSKLKKDRFIKIYSLNNKKLYKIRTLPLDFPEYKLQVRDGYTNGFLATSLRSPIWDFESESRNLDLVGNVSPYSFAFIIDLRKNEIVFYCKSRNNITNLQKHTTKSGEVIYSYNLEVDHDNGIFCPMCYSNGVLLDKNFQKIKGIYRYPAGDVDPHFMYFLDENHYIINTYSFNSIYIKSFGKKMPCVYNVIQEIKDDKLLFQYSLGKFYDEFEKYNLWNSPDKDIVDISHVNSLIIDPKDNNLIVSCGTMSAIIKIERTTGNILWVLGGRGDEFGLTPDQKPIMQHSLSISADGYLTLLNNNHKFWLNQEHYKDYHPSYESEILQFKLNEDDYKVVDFRKYSLKDEIVAQGSVFNLHNNRFLVAYGAEAADNNDNGFIVSEIDVGEDIRYMEMTLSVGSKFDCYNAHLYKTLN